MVSSDEEMRKAMLLQHLRDSIAYHRAREEGLETTCGEPQLDPEIRHDFLAAVAGAMAAMVESGLHGDAADLLNPSPGAREIAAQLCDRAFDGHRLTLDDLDWMT